MATAVALAGAASAIPDQGTPEFDQYMQGLERNGYNLNPDTAWRVAHQACIGGIPGYINLELAAQGSSAPEHSSEYWTWPGSTPARFSRRTHALASRPLSSARPASSSGNNGGRGSPALRPSSSSPALTVVGSPPATMKRSSGASSS